MLLSTLAKQHHPDYRRMNEAQRVVDVVHLLYMVLALFILCVTFATAAETQFTKIVEHSWLDALYTIYYFDNTFVFFIPTPFLSPSDKMAGRPFFF